jgi:hypothetical protein
MRCCGSPTTFTVPSPAAASNGRAHEAAVAFEGLMLRQCLAPLAKPLGFYGDLVLGACTQAVAERSHGGFATMLESLIERARRAQEAPS